MNIKISYFYQIRFFNPCDIPLSTALFDPKWYHMYRGNNYVYLDKHGVINGLRINPLRPPVLEVDMCSGRDGCLFTPDICPYMSAYYKQLNSIVFEDFISELEKHCDLVARRYLLGANPTAVLIVHEKYDNPCSERVVLQRWFQDHGMNLSEYRL